MDGGYGRKPAVVRDAWVMPGALTGASAIAWYRFLADEYAFDGGETDALVVSLRDKARSAERVPPAVLHDPWLEGEIARWNG